YFRNANREAFYTVNDDENQGYEAYENDYGMPMFRDKNNIATIEGDHLSANWSYRSALNSPSSYERESSQRRHVTTSCTGLNYDTYYTQYTSRATQTAVYGPVPATYIPKDHINLVELGKENTTEL
ncbi:unnamed protein product, partial [Owenia fusiformis]